MSCRQVPYSTSYRRSVDITRRKTKGKVVTNEGMWSSSYCTLLPTDDPAQFEKLECEAYARKRLHYPLRTQKKLLSRNIFDTID